MKRSNGPPVPLYIQVSDDLRRRIKNGGLAMGASIGSQAELMKRYGVSRVTLRHALRILEQEELLVTHQGKGSYVAREEVSQNLTSLRSLAEIVKDQGLEHEVRVIDYTWVNPPDDVRSFLEVPSESPVLRIRRQHLVDAMPFALAVIYIPTFLGVRLDRRDVEGYPIYTLMEMKLGIQLGKAVQEIRAVRAEGPTAVLLETGPGSPLLLAERRTYSASGEPVEHITFYYRADSCHFTVTLPRASSFSLVTPPFPGHEPSAALRGDRAEHMGALIRLSKDLV